MKMKVKLVLMCYIAVFISYSLAVDRKQKIATSTSGLETPKRDNQTSDFPNELWVMVLESMPTFPDLVNAILGKLRFETALDAPKFFIELGCEDLHLLHNEIANNPKEAQTHFKSTLLRYEKFLTSPIYKDATFVLLWKLTSMLTATLVGDKAEYFKETDRLVEISQLAVPYVRENIEKKEAKTQNEVAKYQKRKGNFVKYAEHLTLLEHASIVKYNLRQFPDQVVGWMAAGYALILENSKHLENRIPWVIMEDYLGVFSGGNAQYILLINSPEWSLNETSSEWTTDNKQAPAKTNESKDKHSKASDELQLKNRFEINWKFFKGNLTEEDKKRFFLYNSMAAIFLLHIYNKQSVNQEKRENFYHSLVVSAFNDLIVNQKPEKKLDLFMNFALFDLAKDDPFVEKCRKWLLKKCKGTKMLESGLEDQLAILDSFQSRNGLSVVDAYHTMIDARTFGEQNTKNVEYFRELVNSFGQRFESNPVTNLTDLIKMMKVALYTRTANLHLIYRIQHIIVTSIQNPQLLNNLSDEFLEMDSLHSVLFERNDEKMYFQAKEDDDSVRDSWRYLFRKTYDVAQANSIFRVNPNPNETKNDRIKRRFLLKLLWQLARDAFENAMFINQSDINRINAIHTLVYQLAQTDDMSDTSLIRDFVFLTNGLLKNTFESSPDISFKYTQEDNSDFNFVYKPFNESGASDKNPVVFLCIVCSMYAREEHGFDPDDQLIKNYVTVEANIGHLIGFELNVRRMIMSARLCFNSNYIDLFIPHIDVKVFVDSVIEFLLNNSAILYPKEYDIIASVNWAIVASGLTSNQLKQKWDKESIEMLDQYYQCLYVKDTKSFDEMLRDSYENVKPLLGLKLVEPIEW